MVFGIGKPLLRADVVVREEKLAQCKKLGLNEVEIND